MATILTLTGTREMEHRAGEVGRVATAWTLRVAGWFRDSPGLVLGGRTMPLAGRLIADGWAVAWRERPRIAPR